ncbi:MAG: hypothetical protein K0Q72_1279 [Armatimonadetes bacterium]|nr:hypothetical protein [Armatimonadota bacterium]
MVGMGDKNEQVSRTNLRTFPMKSMREVVLFGGLIVATAAAFPVKASTSANPGLAFYGYQQIVANPPYPVVGQPANISVTITNSGDAPATNVAVKLSYNDWGVTFNGWQEIGTVTLPAIPAGGSQTAAYTYTFQNQSHTCLEALIVSADENSDPNDDRGQINLEVVNAGGSFTYPVPVVNNGDQPANLHIAGRCAGGAAGQPHNHRCREMQQDVVLGPGEQIEVPVEIDFSNSPVGEVAEYLVDAYDPADPANPHTRNHVRLVMVHQTAHGLLEQATADLLAAAALESKVPARELRNAAHQVQKALAPRFWVDPNHIVRNGGERVFTHSAAVERKLLDLQPGRSRPVGDLLNHAVRALADAARILAQEAGPATALAGDDLQRTGDYVDAIQSYGRAWKQAR